MTTIVREILQNQSKTVSCRTRLYLLAFTWHFGAPNKTFFPRRANHAVAHTKPHDWQRVHTLLYCFRIEQQHRRHTRAQENSSAAVGSSYANGRGAINAPGWHWILRIGIIAARVSLLNLQCRGGGGATRLNCLNRPPDRERNRVLCARARATLANLLAPRRRGEVNLIASFAARRLIYFAASRRENIEIMRASAQDGTCNRLVWIKMSRFDWYGALFDWIEHWWTGCIWTWEFRGRGIWR